MNNLAEILFGHQPDGHCVICGKLPKEFKDEISQTEWEISSMCQECQDFTFDEGEDNV